MTAIVRRRLEPPKGGLLGWYRADTLAGADGDAIAAWPDSSGHGNALTQTTPGSRPALCHDVAGYRGVWFSSTKDMAIPASLAVDRRSVSAFVMVARGDGGHVGLFGLGPLGGSNLQLENGCKWSRYGPGSAYGSKQAIYRGWTGFTSGSAGFSFVSGEITESIAALAASALTGGTVGTANGYYPITGVYNEVVIYDHALTALELAQLKAYLRARYRLPAATASRRVVCVGDSLTTGYKSTNGFGYTNLMSLSLAACEVYNVGMGSKTLAQMVSDGTSWVDGLYDATKARNIVVIWGGTNDLYTGDTAENTYANLQTFCAARRAVGWKVVVVTTLPRGAADPYETKRQTYNSSIRAGWATFADALADVAADSRIGDAGDNSDGTYYSDGTHLNNTGYGVVAGIVTAAVQGLF